MNCVGCFVPSQQILWKKIPIECALHIEGNFTLEQGYFLILMTVVK